MGVVAEVITVFARKKLFAYKTILYTTFATGVLSFLVWAHHQFVAGIDPRMAHLFTVMTLLISIPISEMVFSYIATLYGGSIEFKTPMLWALAFIAEFLLGGVTGIFLGSSGTDIYLHDTYFVLAHFHYTFFPIAIIGGFTGIYYWFPKMFGRMLNDTLGKVHFWGTIIGFNCTFIPLFITGLAGDHRRIYSYEQFSQLATPGLQELRIIATIGAIITLLFQIVFVINVIKTLREGEKAESNPWRANTLEWAVPSPPPHGNFAEMPTVYRGAYEYGTPERSEDYWPQHLPA
jgi:cytochrome c oxidase subunit 1